MSSRKESLYSLKQTIETKKKLPHKHKKILVEAYATICQHNTSQQYEK
jgi:hypothetical protein